MRRCSEASATEARLVPPPCGEGGATRGVGVAHGSAQTITLLRQPHLTGLRSATLPTRRRDQKEMLYASHGWGYLSALRMLSITHARLVSMSEFQNRRTRNPCDCRKASRARSERAPSGIPC